MDVSEIKFLRWVKFGSHSDLPDSKLPGVYLLAHFEVDPNEKPDPAQSEIIYIGETTGQTLDKRLLAFKRSAFFAKLGHSGGMTYSQRFFGGAIAPERSEKLYVALYGVSADPALSKATVKFVERFCLLCHVEANGEYPICNKE